MKNRKEVKRMLEDRILLLDGSYGSKLMQLSEKEFDLPDILNIKNPELVKKVHKSYVEAGSDIIITNTFGSTPYKLSQFGIEDHKKIIREGVRIARSEAGPKTLVFGNIGPTGKVPYPITDGIFDLYYNNFSEVGRTLFEEGVDGIILETFSDILELKAAVLALRDLSADIFLIAQMTFDINGRTLTGTDPKNFAVTFNDLEVDAIGINCSLGPEEILPLIWEISRYSKKLISVEPNAGLPVLKNGKTIYPVGPDEFSRYIESFWESGVNIIGGCCGTGPGHIEKFLSILGDRKPIQRDVEECFALTCPGNIVTFNEFIVVGERINPAGRKKLRAVMESSDLDYIMKEAKDQVDAGAQVLDVNFGLESSVSTNFMEEVILNIAYGLNIPISLDIQNEDILERLVNIYPGRPLINSSTTESGEITRKLKMITRSGGVLIVLAMGKKVPKNFNDRKNFIENALKILDKLKVERGRILFDPIVLSMGAGSNPMDTLEAIEYLSNKGLKSVYGLSNLSFGMPNRDQLNTAFLVMSVNKGLTSAIMNPLNENMMDLLSSSLMMIGKKELPKKEITNIDLTTKLLLDGDKEGLQKMVMEELERITINEVVDNYLKPAMEKIGDLYAKGDIFLPQLILSAETSKPSFDHIESLIGHSHGKDIFVIATVKGDIHDIGKNIVASIIRSSGYSVIDLGKDVPNEVIVKEVMESKPIALGLSAMMTTTVPRIKEIVDSLKKNKIPVIVLTGGASLNEDVGKALGADYFAKDAVDAIRILKDI